MNDNNAVKTAVICVSIHVILLKWTHRVEKRMFFFVGSALEQRPAASRISKNTVLQ